MFKNEMLCDYLIPYLKKKYVKGDHVHDTSSIWSLVIAIWANDNLVFWSLVIAIWAKIKRPNCRWLK
jgi:hypothetical protein